MEKNVKNHYHNFFSCLNLKSDRPRGGIINRVVKKATKKYVFETVYCLLVSLSYSLRSLSINPTLTIWQHNER